MTDSTFLVGVVSYGLCAAGFAAFSLLLLVSWRGSVHGALLLAACVATALWATVAALYAHNPTFPTLWLEAFEIIRTLLWLTFLVWVIAPMARGNRVIQAIALLAIATPVITLAVVAGHRLLMQPEMLALTQGLHGTFIFGGLAAGLLGLMLAEQLYRNLPGDRRWAMKFLCLGVAAIFGYDLYLYADALLFRQLDLLVWQARGAVQALAVPLIAIAATRNRSWALPVFVSRHVAFHTATIVAAGGYLLLLAIGGYYIRDFGGTWGQFAQIVLLASGAVALVVVLASGDVRARLRVFISKHFFSNKYDYREEWLRLTNRLADEDDNESPYERSVRSVAAIVGSPAGAIWRLQRDAFVPRGGWRLEVSAEEEVPLDAPLVAFLRERKWIVDIAEWESEPDRYEDMSLPAALAGINRIWAIVPLLQQDSLSGFMVLCRPDVNTDITWEDRDLLKTIGRQIANYLGQYEGAQALSQARQFEAFNQLTAFLMHDLKNLIAQQSLVVKNAEKHKHNPEFVDDAMATIGDSVRRMERLLEHIQRRQVHGVVERVDVARVLEDAARRCGDRLPAPTLHNAVSGRLVEANPEEFTMVLVHLIRNAQDATPDDGTVTVTATVDGGRVVIEVTDTGSGMTPEFVRDELFLPFRSTKRSKGMGIGAHQVREFVHRAGGRVNVESNPGAGTRFRFSLPAQLPEDAGGDSQGNHKTAGTGGP